MEAVGTGVFRKIVNTGIFSAIVVAFLLYTGWMDTVINYYHSSYGGKIVDL